MINLIKTFYLLYEATKTVNKINDEGNLQIYNSVENDKYLYYVVSKDVCKKYGLDPEIQFIKYVEKKDE